MRKQHMFWTSVFLFAATVHLDGSVFQVNDRRLSPAADWFSWSLILSPEAPQLNNTAVIDSFVTKTGIRAPAISRGTSAQRKGSISGLLPDSPRRRE